MMISHLKDAFGPALGLMRARQFIDERPRLMHHKDRLMPLASTYLIRSSATGNP
jgi:hypothetical protein